MVLCMDCVDYHDMFDLGCGVSMGFFHIWVINNNIRIYVCNKPDVIDRRVHETSPMGVLADVIVLAFEADSRVKRVGEGGPCLEGCLVFLVHLGQNSHIEHSTLILEALLFWVTCNSLDPKSVK